MNTTEKIRFGEYMVHIDTSNNRLEFQVYPVFDVSFIGESTTTIEYIDKATEPNTTPIFDKDKCLMQMEGSYCWRGVWEGRICFTDDEYWGEELAYLSELYNEYIVKWCKEFIKKRDPSINYD